MLMPMFSQISYDVLCLPTGAMPMEQWFMLIIDIFQTISSVVLSSVAIVLAVMVYRIQRDRNRAKLMLTDELIEDDERGEPAQGIRIRNVGLVRAVNIKLLADIEEWKDDQLLNSKFHERFDAYSDNLAVLEPILKTVGNLQWCCGKGSWGCI